MSETRLKACWTCRESNFCEITHSSSAYEGTLFRCVNCKAVYPDFALATRGGDTRLVEAEVVERVAEAIWNSARTVGGPDGPLSDQSPEMQETCADAARAAIEALTPCISQDAEDDGGK